MAFPSAGRKFDTLAVLVKVINLSALGHPLSFFVNGSHGQHDVTMGLCPGGSGSWIAKSQHIPLDTKFSLQYSCIICGHISIGISLGRAITKRLASCEFHCFSTSSAEFQSVVPVSYTHLDVYKRQADDFLKEMRAQTKELKGIKEALQQLVEISQSNSDDSDDASE